MNLLKLYPLMSFAVILLAIVGQCLSQRHPWLLLAAGGLAALSRTISDGPRGITLSRPVSLLLTSVALIWSVVIAMGNLEQPVPAIGQFVVWLTVIKLYERHTLENEAERLILSLLLMVLACLISIDLIFGFLLIAWSTLGLITLMLFQLTCAAEKAQQQRARVLGIATEVAPNPISGTGVRRHYRNITLASTLFIFLISTTMFLLFPRGLTSKLSTVALRSMAPREVGLSEGVDLLGQTRISLSAEQVLSVGLEDDEGEMIQLNRALRLRASALTAYRGDGIWDAESFGMTNFEIQPEQWKSFFMTSDDSEIVLQDVILDSPSEQLVSMSVPVSLETQIGTSIIFRPSSQTIRVKRDSPTPLAYRIQAIPEPPLFRSMTSFNAEPGLPSPNAYQNPRVRALAVSLLESAGLADSAPLNTESRLQWNIDAARVFEQHLKYGDFEYTLDLTEVGASEEMSKMDPVERFLLHQQFGHCEYFASALMGLCHSVEISSRLVTGYVTNRFDETTGRYIALKSDAHAWNEIIGPGPRWVVFDPTPPANVPGTRAITMGPIDRLFWFWSWLEGQWRFNVLGYDTETQEYLSDSMFPGIKEDLAAGLDSVGETILEIRNSIGIGSIISILISLLLACVVVVIVVWSSRRRRRRILRYANAEGLSSVEVRRLMKHLGFYYEMLERLSLAGLSKPSWQPPIAFARTLERSHPELSSKVGEMASWYYAMRYGGDRDSKTDLRMRQVLEELDEALKE